MQKNEFENRNWRITSLSTQQNLQDGTVLFSSDKLHIIQQQC